MVDIAGYPGRSDSQQTTDTTFPAGTPVDVRSRFVGEWSRGFEVVDRLETGYLLRRASDHTILPSTFAAEDVRPQRRSSGLWQ